MKNMDIKLLESQLINSAQLTNKSKSIVNRDFEDVLKQVSNKDEEIKFSKHAKARMDIRGMSLNKDETNRLKSGFNKAQEKGVKDALIIVGDKAFIASIKNKTVITTMNKEQLEDNVFTNIDGAVII